MAAAERRLKAVELRIAGVTFRGIASALGVEVAQAHRDVWQALAAKDAETEKRAKELRALELERLEMPVEPLAKAINSGNAPPLVLARLCDSWVRLSESRRKLVGADAAARVELDAVLVIGGVDDAAMLGLKPGEGAPSSMLLGMKEHDSNGVAS